MASPRLYISLSLFSFVLIASGGYSSTFTIINKCNHLVWPGILSNAGTAQLPDHRFCDCGSSTLECSGRGAAPPATLAELTLNGADGLDFYDVSLVDGYNLPMLIAPQSGTGGNCTTTGCVVDLNSACPNELKVIDSGNGESLACRSACEAFGDAEYCCSGAYATPDTCKPSSYAQFFKNACPRAYSYAYDDGTSTFTCAGADYVITFCPAPTTSQKSANGLQNSLSASVSAGKHNTSPYFIGALVTIAAAIWQLF
ncbi:hypothetical protein OIU78_020602 [Salix suchowensis]|nr:hypothetical protein OIU78_020602 [Salix suchowensis]